MKKILLVIVGVGLLLFGVVNVSEATLILFEDFEDSSGFTSGGNAVYWGIASLGGTQSYPSYFVQGGNQSGNIFYGVNGWDSSAIMTISLPDLTGYTNFQLTMALAAPDGTRWENTHRDSLIIRGTTGLIDSFLPTGRGAPLQSQVHSIDLHYEFQDFAYIIDSSLESLTFAFASTANDEVIGIDSVRITGDPLSPVPEPSTFLLVVAGLVGLSGLRKKFKK